MLRVIKVIGELDTISEIVNSLFSRSYSRKINESPFKDNTYKAGLERRKNLIEKRSEELDDRQFSRRVISPVAHPARI